MLHSHILNAVRIEDFGTGRWAKKLIWCNRYEIVFDLSYLINDPEYDVPSNIASLRRLW